MSMPTCRGRASSRPLPSRGICDRVTFRNRSATLTFRYHRPCRPGLYGLCSLHWAYIYFELHFAAAPNADLAKPPHKARWGGTCGRREHWVVSTDLARTFAALSATNEAILYAKSPDELYRKV